VQAAAAAARRGVLCGLPCLSSDCGAPAAGRALRIAADKAQYTLRLWPQKPPPSAPSKTPTPTPAEGEEPQEQPQEDGQEGQEGAGAEGAEGGGAAASAELAEAAASVAAACEALEAALDAALPARNYQAAAEAAMALCVCVGEARPARAAELLNIYQSCKLVSQLTPLLLAALPPDSPERVLLRKLEHLAAAGALPDASPQARKALESATSSSIALRRLTVNFSDVNLSAVRESLEASVCVITLALEQGHEGVVVWASWFVGGAPGEDEEEERRKGPQVGRFPLDPALFSKVQAAGGLLRAKQKRKHVDLSYLDDGLPTRTLALRVLEGTRELLQAPLQAIDAYLEQHQDLETAVLICDKDLCNLPLEACAPMSRRFTGVSRDFSLAMHMHRRAAAAAIDKGGLRYIVDPRNQDVEAASVGTVKRRAGFTTTCQAFADDLEESFAGGVKGSDHIPSHAELQRNISSASLLLYQGAGPLLCHMLPALVSTLNLDKCQCAVLLDRAENEVSERRQNKLDTSILPAVVQLRGKRVP
jgi:hypothetical protein